MKQFNRCSFVRIIVELLVSVLLTVFCFKYMKVSPPLVKRGFYCHDETLKYPYHADTIGKDMLLGLGFYGPIVLVALGEILLLLVEGWQTTALRSGRLIQALLHLHYNLTCFLCGFAMHSVFMLSTKNIVGRLRPNFFDVCQPYRIVDGSTCDNPQNHGLYIQDYECKGNSVLGANQSMMDDAHLSFFSGHSSIIFYGMVFFILYLQRFSQRLKRKGLNGGLFIMIVQMCCALLAWLVSMSRVMDNRHHWSDVLVGILLGILFAIAVTLQVCQQLKSVNTCPEGVASSNAETASTTILAAPKPNTISIQ